MQLVRNLLLKWGVFGACMKNFGNYSELYIAEISTPT